MELFKTSIITILMFTSIMVVFYFLFVSTWQTSIIKKYQRPYVLNRKDISALDYFKQVGMMIVFAFMFVSTLYIGAGVFSVMELSARNYQNVPSEMASVMTDSSHSFIALGFTVIGIVIINVVLCVGMINRVVKFFTTIFMHYKRKKYQMSLQDRLKLEISDRCPYETVSVYEEIKDVGVNVVLTAQEEVYLSHCLLIKSEVSDHDFDTLKGKRGVRLSYNNVMGENEYMRLWGNVLYRDFCSDKWNNLESVSVGYDKPVKKKRKWSIL